MYGRTKTTIALALLTALTGCAGGSAPQSYGMSRQADMGGADEAPMMEVSAGGEASGADMATGMAAEPVPVSPGASVTTTTTTTTTVTIDSTPEVIELEPVPQQLPQARLLTAGSVADHDRRAPYLDFMSRHPYEAGRIALDMTRRVRFRVVDAYNRPVPDARISLSGAGVAIEARTYSDGNWDFYPGVSMPGRAGQLRARVQLGQLAADTIVDVPAYGDGQDVTVRFTGVAAAPPPVLDLGFLIDVTGSMGDELRYVNAEVADIVQRVRAEVPEVQVRVGAVFYRDRTDSVPLAQIQMTGNVQGFASAMQRVFASGGGDYPEDVNSGLEAAMHRLSWSEGPATRVLVLIGDAPAQRYATNFTYREAMVEAAQRGIRILPVAASGANREVEYLWRALGAFTSAPYVYLTDDSGIGNPHQEADTDRVAVEYFNDLLTRLMISDLRGQGMHEPGPFGPNGQM